MVAQIRRARLDDPQYMCGGPAGAQAKRERACDGSERIARAPGLHARPPGRM